VTPVKRVSWLLDTLRRAGWAPGLVLAFWAIAAKGFDAYLRYPYLDMPTHFAGGAACAYVLGVALVNLEPVVGRIPVLVRLTLALSLTALAAVIWEFLEFGSDTLLGSHLNLGVTDTLSDLFFGILGATVVVGIGLVRSLPLRTEPPHAP